MCSESESEPHYAQPTPVNGLDSTLEKGADVNDTGDIYGDTGFSLSTLTRQKSAHDSENSLYEANTKPLEYYQWCSKVMWCGHMGIILV